MIIKLAGNGGNMSAAGVGTPQSRSLPTNLGVSFTDFRMLNPSMESSSTGGFSTNSIQAPSQTHTFSSAINTRNNVFVITLEETGINAVQNALALLNANPAVEIAEPDFLYEFFATPNDPMFEAQYALEKINATGAWDITTGSMSVVVGVVDSGIDGTHPDLVDNLWVNPNPNQNGYVNDIHGYNFTGRAGGVPTDTHGHGTHVAGIIGAKGNNGIGTSGVNWDVSLAWLGIDLGDGYVSASAAIEAINYANNHNITILNNSWGGSGYSEILKEAISHYNGLFVAAAGNSRSDNDFWPHYPSSYNLPNVISVASTDASDNLSFFSNYGAASVHIAAPGSEILSLGLNGDYRVAGGTSMASPHVAGVAALLKAANPEIAPEAIREILIGSARQADTLTAHAFGIVDAHSAVSFDIGNLYTITYNFLDGGTEPVAVKVFPGGRLREPMEPSRTGYVFDGWHTGEYGGVPYNFSDAVNRDITLYARWFIPVPGMYYVEFPDLNFQREVLRLLNNQGDGHKARSSIVSADKALLAAFTSLDVSNRSIRDITGLRYFTGLTKLDCSDNELTEVNITNNTRLMELNGSYNQMLSPDSVTGWLETGLVLDSNFKFYPQKKAFMDLQNEIDAYGSAYEDMVITIRTDIAMTSCLTVPGNPNGKTLTITSDNMTRALIRERSGNGLLVVNAGASVILKNIIIDGNKDAYPNNGSPLAYVEGGDFTLGGGAILRNNRAYVGGGVDILKGTLTMDGGEISGNTVSYYGGGVNVDLNGALTINSGKISGNTAGSGYGGGVRVYGGALSMHGGEISGNTGDGVSVYSASFIMNNGKISGNIGGGVFISGGEITGSGAFTMNGGEIAGNTSAINGGGVSVSGRGAFTMNGGEITGNTAYYDGGGVYVSSTLCPDGDGWSICSGKLTLGGKAVVRDNKNNNVYLVRYGQCFYDGVCKDSTSYITLSADTPPETGMRVGVKTEAEDGVIVKSGAMPGDEAYFFADQYGHRVTYEDGQLRINGPAIIYGDVNWDGRVTPLDATLLARRLAGQDGIMINEKSADVNNDGRVTPLDQTILRRHLAGWAGYETLPFIPDLTRIFHGISTAGEQ